MDLGAGIEIVGKAIDVIGVAVIALGGVLAVGFALGRLLRKQPDSYRLFRQQLGRAILLGLELLVAADIIRTVAVTPDLKSVGVLAGIVAIRTFLSFSLEVEMTGRWPWQQGEQPRSTEPAVTVTTPPEDIR